MDPPLGDNNNNLEHRVISDAEESSQNIHRRRRRRQEDDDNNSNDTSGRAPPPRQDDEDDEEEERRDNPPDHDDNEGGAHSSAADEQSNNHPPQDPALLHNNNPQQLAPPPQQQQPPGFPTGEGERNTNNNNNPIPPQPGFWPEGAPPFHQGPFSPFVPQQAQQFPMPFFPPPQLPSLPPFCATLSQQQQAQQQGNNSAPNNHHPAVALAQYYESQMRDHAAAYANAAAGAAWAAMQVAQAAHLQAFYSPHAAAEGAPCLEQQSPTEVATAAATPPQQRPHRLLASQSRRKRAHQQRPTAEVNVSQQQQQHSFSGKVRRRLRSDGDSSSSGSSFSWQHRPRNKNKKKKARSDETLLGKMAVSALYEWCQKRHLTPRFEAVQPAGLLEFDVTVTLPDKPDVILGRGKGATKSAAKQVAARRALQRLVPGVVFDEVTGILVSLPPADDPNDLAHLAKQLAIRHEEEDGAGDVNKSIGIPGGATLSTANKRRPSSNPPKRTLDVYPGTSTTTSDDDDATYYSTRGASVCTSLLYALISFNPNLPESPECSYTVDSSWRGGPDHQNAQLRRKVASSNRVIHVHRGPITCTVRLPQIQADGSTRVLEATGIGSNKREARHVASARLLALLFPECQDMVEVKAAAEAAREEYARARKREAEPAPRRTSASLSLPSSARPFSRLAQWQEDCRDVWQAVEDEQMQQILSSSSSPLATESTQARQGSRVLQIEAAVDRALQRVKDEHESLPVELTEDDVGRTLLRRASAEDLPRLRKLLGEPATTADEQLLSQWWSTCSFVLVLCRAVAAFEDPPLGCAVLTLGFDMTQGKALRVAQMGNEPHMPPERLVECLQTFAVCMKATLLVDEPNAANAATETTPIDAIRSLLVTRAAVVVPAAAAAAAAAAPVSSSTSCLREYTWPLQSVLEEEESEGASSMEQRRLLSAQRAASSKPSKRTRRL